MNEMNDKVPHPNFETIVDNIVADAMDPAFESHIRECSECNMEVNRTSQLMSVMRNDLSEDAPSYAIASLLRAFDETTQPVAKAKRTAGDIIRGILRLDSLNLGPAFGLRSASASQSRQLLYSINGGTLDLRVASTKAGFDLTGQVLGLIGGGTVMLESASTLAESSIDADGMFRFKDVASGTYKLSLKTGDDHCQIDDIQL